MPPEREAGPQDPLWSTGVLVDELRALTRVRKARLVNHLSVSSAARFCATVSAALLLFIQASGCQKGEDLSGTVVLYTSVPTDVMDVIKAEFERTQPGVELDVFRSGTGKVMDRIHAEIEQGQVGGDVIWVADFTVGEELKAAGELLKYESPEASGMMSILKDKDGYYAAARLLNMVVAYNTDKVTDRPTGYRDLLNPDYKGKVGLADPSYSGAALYTVATLVQSEMFGWDYFARLHENETQILEGNTPLNQAIGAGDLWMGITIDFMVRAQQAEDPAVPVDYVFPEEGSVLVPSPIAITKDSQNVAAAKAFVDFVLSKEGQTLMSAEGIAPVRLDVAPPSGIPTITQMDIMPSDAGDILNLKEDTKRIFGDLFAGEDVEGTSDKTVTLYTSVPTAIIEELRQDYEAKHPGAYLRLYRAGTGAVVEKINQEVAAGQVQADLIWVADFTVAADLKEKGVLLSYTPPEAAALLNILKDEDGYYFAGRLLIIVVAFNTNRVGTPPGGYKDVLDAAYRGRIGHDTPETSGSQLWFLGTLLQDPEFGEDFLRGLAGNSPQIQTSTKTTQRIAAGELDMGITIDYTVRKLLKGDPEAPIDYVYPEDGVAMVPSPIAIFKDSPHIEAAKVFERYVLSKDGQTLLRDLGGFVPVRLDVAPPERITSITQLKVIPSDREWIREHKSEIVTKFIDIFGRQAD